MAIKGKGRSKRRGVAAAPKPVYVEPKRPLLGRRWFQITVLVVIVLGAAAGVTAGLIVKHNSNRAKALKAVETSITQRFGTLVDSDLSGVGQPFQTQFTAFPQLATDITDFKSGKLTASQAETKSAGYATAARDAAASLQKIPTATMIQGHADLVPLSDSQNLLGEALQVYEQVADQFKLATAATGFEQRALLAHASKLQLVAQRIFGDGYQKLTNVRGLFNLLSTTPPQPLTPTGPPVPPAPVVPAPKQSK